MPERIPNLTDCYNMIDDIYRGIMFDKIISGQPINPDEFARSNRGWTKPFRSSNGSTRGYDVVTAGPAQTPTGGVNSNIGGGSYGSGSRNFGVNVGGSTPTTGGQIPYAGATRVSTGTRLATVAGRINAAVTAVAVGAQLGAKIDGALYKIGKFFNLNPPESLNPETWANMASSEGGQWLIRTLFGIDSNGDTTMYMPEDMIDYMYKYWVEQGMFDQGIEAEYEDPSVEGIPQPIPLVNGSTITIFESLNNLSVAFRNAEHIVICRTPTNTYLRPISFQTTSPIEISIRGGAWETTYTFTGTTLKGTPYQYNTYIMVDPLPSNIATGNIYYISDVTAGGTWDKIATTIIDGSVTQPIPGVEPEPNQTMVDPSQVPSGTPVTQAYPQLFNNPIKETVPQADGTNKDIIYYPVPIPQVTDWDYPTTGTPNQSDPIIRITDPTDLTQPIVDIITNPTPDPGSESGPPSSGGPGTPPDTGGGSSPTPVAPTGDASSMWAVYNPTQGQLDDFGSWLWSSNMVDQIKKLFADPMQAIIGVHKVYVTPPTGSQVNIKCGYIDSGCPAAKVTGQYVTVDCGTVNVREYYGNVLDYAPYTEVSLYLPFIGIVKLDVADVMRGSVNVKYHVDVITGACLAEVKINRDGESAIMYQYSGSAIVTYPVSAGSYASAVTGVLSLAAGVAGTIMTGGAAAPALIGGAVGLSHLHADVQHSGGFSGSPGAMGGKKPYLIISRAQDATPEDFEKYEGKPASKTVKLSNCDGFVRVKSINIDAVPATYQELDQIVSLLKTGVII